MRDKVDKEIDRLLTLGVLKPIDHAQYAPPIVPVLKRNGSIRIGADYSTGVNKQLVIDQYPLPTVRELFAKLYGGQPFTKLDLSIAYNQFVLDDHSQDLTCIKTHTGVCLYIFAWCLGWRARPLCSSCWRACPACCICSTHLQQLNE